MRRRTGVRKIVSSAHRLWRHGEKRQALLAAPFGKDLRPASQMVSGLSSSREETQQVKQEIEA